MSAALDDMHNGGPREVPTVVIDSRIATLPATLRELEAAPAVATASLCRWPVASRNSPASCARIITNPYGFCVSLFCATEWTENIVYLRYGIYRAPRTVICRDKRPPKFTECTRCRSPQRCSWCPLQGSPHCAGPDRCCGLRDSGRCCRSAELEPPHDLAPSESILTAARWQAKLPAISSSGWLTYPTGLPSRQMLPTRPKLFC